MRKKPVNNGGFTLIELIVSIAILAFLMVAVTGLMSMNTVTNKKTKADITVQTSAQETYASLMDSIMQAKSIVIEGCELTTNPTFDATNIGASYSDSITPVRCVNKTVATPSDITFDSLKTVSNSGGVITTSYKNIYVDKITIEYAVKIDASYIPGSTVSGEVITFTPAGSSNSISLTKGDVDTCTITYLFEKNNMYITRTYKYMTRLNNTYTNDDEKANCLYSNSLNYLVTTTGIDIPGVVANVDADNNAMSLELYFADKSMSYTSEGMVKVRNSYVIKEFN